MPILVSAVVVFVASALVGIALPHHKKDIKTLPNEKAVTDHLETLGIPPGTYMYPGCGDSGKDMNSPEFKARFKAGPWGSLNVMAGPPSFARNLVLTLVFYSSPWQNCGTGVSPVVFRARNGLSEPLF